MTDVKYFRLVELMIDRGMSWEQALTRADNHLGKEDGFYISKRDVWGKKLFILATQKENSSHLFRVARYVRECLTVNVSSSRKKGISQSHPLGCRSILNK